MKKLLTPAVALVALGSLPALAQRPPAQRTPARPNPQMKAVLGALAALHPRPIEKLTPAAARKQPGPADAVKSLMKRQGQDPAPEPVANVVDRKIPGVAGPIPARIYTPPGDRPAPVLVYFHGGGWVIANINTYDASCRALANAVQCVVVSVGYRQAPEHRFPAAPEDAYAATQWVMKNAATLGGDPQRVAVAGESAGGNLATVVCLMARDRKGRMPVYQLLVYPVANYAFDTPSYLENARAKPLNKPMMEWFFRYYLRKPADGRNPYVSPLRARDLTGLPPATVVTAQIDPLRSEGQAYGERLRHAGVTVRYRNFPGVTHEFFGMGAVVDEAKSAQAFAAAGLKGAFGK